MFLHAGAVLDSGWIEETTQFIQNVSVSGRPRAGIFRYSRSPYAEPSGATRSNCWGGRNVRAGRGSGLVDRARPLRAARRLRAGCPPLRAAAAAATRPLVANPAAQPDRRRLERATKAHAIDSPARKAFCGLARASSVRAAQKVIDMAKVRIAVAGAGLIGLRHIEEIAASPNCALAVDHRPRTEGRRRRAEIRRAAVRVARRNAFAKDKPDGVVIATPNQMHVEQGLQCIAAGVAVSGREADRAYARGRQAAGRSGREGRTHKLLGRPSPRRTARSCTKARRSREVRRARPASSA